LRGGLGGGPLLAAPLDGLADPPPEELADPPPEGLAGPPPEELALAAAPELEAAPELAPATPAAGGAVAPARIWRNERLGFPFAAPGLTGRGGGGRRLRMIDCWPIVHTFVVIQYTSSPAG